MRYNTPPGLTFPLGRYCCWNKPTLRVGTKKGWLFASTGFSIQLQRIPVVPCDADDQTPTSAIFPPQRRTPLPRVCACARITLGAAPEARRAHARGQGLTSAVPLGLLSVFCFVFVLFFFFIYGCLRESPGCRFEKRDVFSKDFTFLKKQSAFGLALTFHPAGWEVADKMAAAAAAGRVGGRRSSCWGIPARPCPATPDRREPSPELRP